jgi:hypothetical protein
MFRKFGRELWDRAMNLKINFLANVRERLAVSKRTTHRIYMGKFNLKKLKKLEGKEQYRVELSNSFAALENLDTWVDINRASGTIRI